VKSPVKKLIIGILEEFICFDFLKQLLILLTGVKSVSL